LLQEPYVGLTNTILLLNNIENWKYFQNPSRIQKKSYIPNFIEIGCIVQECIRNKQKETIIQKFIYTYICIYELIKWNNVKLP